MVIYIDKDNKCYTAEAEGLRAFDVPFFDDKCEEFVTSYIYIPDDEKLTRADGEEFEGEAKFPFVDYRDIEVAQLRYELADREAALNLLGVTANG